MQSQARFPTGASAGGIYRLLARGVGCVASVVALLGAAAHAEPGIAPGEIRLGVLMPLSSDFAEVGIAYLKGAQAAAEEINRSGGVQGRKIRLVPLDTLSVPAESLAQAKDILRAAPLKEQVFALLGTQGQASTDAVAPLLDAVGVPLIGPATGLVADVRDPNGWIFPVRGGDAGLMERMVRQFGTMSIKRIAVIHPRTPDALRQIQLLRGALKGSPLSLVADVEVGASNMDLGPQLAPLSGAKPDVILSLASYVVTDALVKQMRNVGYKGLFVAHSDVGTRSLVAALKESARGLGIVSGLPSPQSITLTLVREYRKSMDKIGATQQVGLDESSLEGYLCLRVLSEGLHSLGANPTRRGLRDALVSKPFELSGLQFDYGRSTERGLQTHGSLYVIRDDGHADQ